MDASDEVVSVTTAPLELTTSIVTSFVTTTIAGFQPHPLSASATTTTTTFSRTPTSLTQTSSINGPNATTVEPSRQLSPMPAGSIAGIVIGSISLILVILMSIIYSLPSLSRSLCNPSLDLEQASLALNDTTSSFTSPEDQQPDSTIQTELKISSPSTSSSQSQPHLPKHTSIRTTVSGSDSVRQQETETLLSICPQPRQGSNAKSTVRKVQDRIGLENAALGPARHELEVTNLSPPGQRECRYDYNDWTRYELD